MQGFLPSKSKNNIDASSSSAGNVTTCNNIDNGTVTTIRTSQDFSANHDDQEGSGTFPSDFLISVPFYLYEELSWINATIKGNPVADSNSDSGLRWKHGDDYWLLKAAHEHPMRTQNIQEAKLFFIPTLLNHYDFYYLYEKKRVCVNERCNKDLLQYTMEQLENSPTFQSFPERHLIVRSHWRERYNDKDFKKNPEYTKFFLEMVPRMNVVNFERQVNPTHRYTMPAYKVGTPCEQSDVFYHNKTLDFALIASMNKGKGSRKNVCSWLNHSSSSSSSNRVVCGPGSRCPALAQAKFGFHVKGDTWGSQRLMDILVSGTVPIFTHVAQYDVQGSWIDWKQLSYYLPIHNSSFIKQNKRRVKFQLTNDEAESSFLKRVEQILQDTAGYERRQKVVLEHIPFFDMTTIYPFDTYMYLLQAELYPETRHSKSRWSALILPPTLYTEP